MDTKDKVFVIILVILLAIMAVMLYAIIKQSEGGSFASRYCYDKGYPKYNIAESENWGSEIKSLYCMNQLTVEYFEID